MSIRSAALDMSSPEVVHAQAKMQQLLARAATDAGFRQKLIADARTAVAEFNGVDVSAIPETFNVRFVENEGDATIVLPDVVDPAAELSESELETVAGGSIGEAIAAFLAIFTAGYDAGQEHRVCTAQ